MVLVHKLQDDKNSSKASPFLRRKSIKKNKKKDYERSQRNAAVLLIALSFKGKQKNSFYDRLVLYDLQQVPVFGFAS